MIHGICEYAQRTSSLRMCNTLHENDACILHIHISSFVRNIFQDARAKLYNTELAISKLYGHVWTTWFSRFFSHWNSLPSWTELAQEPSNRLILCWGYFTWKHISGILFLRAYIREKHHFKCPEISPGKFQEFPLFSDFKNLKMLALRHFGICGFLRIFAGVLRIFAGVLRKFAGVLRAHNFQRFRWQLSLCSPQPSDIEKHPGHPIAFPRTKKTRNFKSFRCLTSRTHGFFQDFESPGVFFVLVWGFEFEGLLQLRCHKRMRKWCETAVFPAFHKFQHSLWTLQCWLYHES